MTNKSINFTQVVTYLLRICCGDVESNPGPKKQHQIFLCHWNLNGLAVHNVSKNFANYKLYLYQKIMI